MKKENTTIIIHTILFFIVLLILFYLVKKYFNFEKFATKNKSLKSPQNKPSRVR